MVAQLVEQTAVNRSVGGSSPSHRATLSIKIKSTTVVVVVQLVRTLDCDSRSRGFKSHLSPQFLMLQINIVICIFGGNSFEDIHH